MKADRFRTTFVVVSFLTAIWLPVAAIAAEKLTPEQAGTIETPTGQIAFTRDGNIWTMNFDGSDQQLVAEIGNTDGRMSWSPDGRRIAYTRSGKVNTEGPDYMGGQHKVYDIFLTFLDSADANNRMWWYRITLDMGSRDPEWSADGSRIVFWKDINANLVNAGEPSYQVCTMAPDGSDFEYLRKDFANLEGTYMISPSMNSNGDLAFVYFLKLKPVGLVVLTKDQYMMSMDSIQAIANKNLNYVAPTWSPDGKWIAFVSNSMTNAGLFIATPDLKEKYLVATPPVGTYLYTMAPSFSPDSKWLTFATTDGSVWTCDITGNGLRRLTGPGLDRAPAWSKASPK